MTNAPIWLTDSDDANRLLSEDDNALLIGMVLDQQIPMEKAFTGPLVIAQRMGGRFDPAAIAALSEDDFAALCSERPAIHRFPASMAKRVRQVCQVLVDRYDGQAANIWSGVTTGDELRRAVEALPGFGKEKAAIFIAVLGKMRGVTPPGWEEAAGPFGQPGVHRSVADVRDAESLAKVRQTKQSAKAARKAASAAD